MKNSAINIDPEIMSGEPVFNGTRVTIKTLFDYPEEGDIGVFFKNFPYITREMVTNVLKEVANRGIPKHKKYATLLDENIGVEIQKILFEYDTKSIRDMGWLGKKMVN